MEPFYYFTYSVQYILTQPDKTFVLYHRLLLFGPALLLVGSGLFLAISSLFLAIYYLFGPILFCVFVADFFCHIHTVGATIFCLTLWSAFTVSLFWRSVRYRPVAVWCGEWVIILLCGGLAVTGLAFKDSSAFIRLAMAILWQLSSWSEPISRELLRWFAYFVSLGCSDFYFIFAVHVIVAFILLFIVCWQCALAIKFALPCQTDFSFKSVTRRMGDRRSWTLIGSEYRLERIRQFKVFWFAMFSVVVLVFWSINAISLIKIGAFNSIFNFSFLTFPLTLISRSGVNVMLGGLMSAVVALAAPVVVRLLLSDELRLPFESCRLFSSFISFWFGALLLLCPYVTPPVYFALFYFAIVLLGIPSGALLDVLFVNAMVIQTRGNRARCAVLKSLINRGRLQWVERGCIPSFRRTKPPRVRAMLWLWQRRLVGVLANFVSLAAGKLRNICFTLTPEWKGVSAPFIQKKGGRKRSAAGCAEWGQWLVAIISVVSELSFHGVSAFANYTFEFVQKLLAFGLFVFVISIKPVVSAVVFTFTIVLILKGLALLISGVVHSLPVYALLVVLKWFTTFGVSVNW